jgi:hypothetical protein
MDPGAAVAKGHRSLEGLPLSDLGLTCVLLPKYGMDVWESTLMKIMNDVESPAQEIGKADVPCIRVTATPGTRTASSRGHFQPILSVML